MISEHVENESHTQNGIMEHNEDTRSPRPFGLIAQLEEPWYQSLTRSVRELFNPTKQAPLELTSRPVDGATFGGMDNMDEPWYHSLFTSVRDLVSPQKLPPLEVTSKPVEVGTIWGAYGGKQSSSAGISVVVHLVVVLLLLFAFQKTMLTPKPAAPGVIVYTPPFQPKLPKADTKAGGGGGSQPKLPVNHGAAPKFQKAFVPPDVTVKQPKLAVQTGITAVVPQIQADNYGDPLSSLMATNGGGGHGTGIGSGDGSGYGPGSGGGQGGGTYRPGGDVSAPTVLVRVDPEYSEEARKAKFSGEVLLSIVVDEHGLPRDIKVIRPLGMGLDEKAIEAVQHWRFTPGRKGGHAVRVQATVAVSFRLL